MRDLAEAMRVNNSSVFELTDHTFYERDFVFFADLMSYLAKLTGCDEKNAMESAKLSQLLYLSSLLHFSLTEKTETTEQLRNEKQMPVLLGDLLYGRFISTLTETGKNVYLPNYLAYLKQFNRCCIEDLEGRFSFGMTQAASMLMEQSARVMAAFAGTEPIATLYEAELFFAEEWNPRKGDKISSMEELDALLERTFGQGAVVC